MNRLRRFTRSSMVFQHSQGNPLFFFFFYTTGTMANRPKMIRASCHPTCITHRGAFLSLTDVQWTLIITFNLAPKFLTEQDSTPDSTAVKNVFSRSHQNSKIADLKDKHHFSSPHLTCTRSPCLYISHHSPPPPPPHPSPLTCLSFSRVL